MYFWYLKFSLWEKSLPIWYNGLSGSCKLFWRLTRRQKWCQKLHRSIRAVTTRCHVWQRFLTACLGPGVIACVTHLDLRSLYHGYLVGIFPTVLKSQRYINESVTVDRNNEDKCMMKTSHLTSEINFYHKFLNSIFRLGINRFFVNWMKIIINVCAENYDIRFWIYFTS